MEEINWDEKLTRSLFKYDLDAMKEAVKNGAKVDNEQVVLHRVINRDRLDLLEYFCFSPELKEHYKINYEYHNSKENIAFPYAAMSGAINCLKFMLRDERVSHHFKMEEYASNALYQACEAGQTEVVEFLLSAPETKRFCNIRENDFKAIKSAIVRHRVEFISHIIMNWDFELVKELMPIIEVGASDEMFKHRTKYFPEEPSITYKRIFETRKLKEELSEELSENKSQSHKPRKI